LQLNLAKVILIINHSVRLHRNFMRWRGSGHTTA